MAKKVLALISPNKGRYTETFIHAHRVHLDAEIVYLYGGWRPQFSESQGPIVNQSWVAKIYRRLEAALLPKQYLTSHEKAISQLLTAQKADVALAEFGITGAKVFRACKAANVPLIVHFHGFDAHINWAVKDYATVYREMFEYASFVIGVSKFMCAQLLHLGVPEHKLVYNPYGPNDDFFKLSPSSTSRTFVSIGRFIPKKAPHITIKAFAKAVSQYPDLRLKMGGDGESLKACMELAKSLQVDKYIEFAGPISHDTVKEWFTDALAFVQHSVTAEDGDTEGTPVAVLEASAAGLPVIATRHAGIPDVIIHNETGILVEEHDQKGFEEALIRIAGEQSLSRNMGAAGRKNIAQHFTMEKHINIINDLIQRCANKA